MEKINVKLKKDKLKVDVDRQDFALALKTWRLRSDLTQEEAGRRLGGVSRFTIMRAEAGKPVTWETAYKLFAKLANQLEIENKEQQ